MLPAMAESKAPARRPVPGIALLLILACWFAGCASSTQPLAGPQDEPHRIVVHEGDVLKVLTRDGQHRTIKVLGIDATGLETRRGRVDYSDMVFVERVGTRPATAGEVTAGVVLAIVGTVLAVESYPMMPGPR